MEPERDKGDARYGSTSGGGMEARPLSSSLPTGEGFLRAQDDLRGTLGLPLDAIRRGQAMSHGE